MTKLDSQGAVEWERAWPAVPFWWAGALCAAETEDGGFVIAGYRLVENVGRLDMPVIKFDAQGGLVWNRLRRKDQHACIHSMTAAPDNGLMLAGYIKPVQAQAGSEQDIWLLRLNAADGSIAGQRPDDLGFSELAVAIRPSGHERFAVAGNILSPIQYPQQNPSPIFALEVDGGGSLLAQRAFLLPDGIATATSITVAHQDGLVRRARLGWAKTICPHLPSASHRRGRISTTGPFCTRSISRSHAAWPTGRRSARRLTGNWPWLGRAAPASTGTPPSGA